MERIVYQPDWDAGAQALLRARTPAEAASVVVTTTDWRAGLPAIYGQRMTIRELQISDAPSLFALLTTEEVTRFISPPPTTVEGFEQFIAWTHRQRAAGQYVCLAVVAHDSQMAVGIFQVRALDAKFEVAEWGFALGSAYWGRGLFVESANAVMSFSFETLGVHRLEARASVENGRGNRALRKIGAALEGRLRQSFRRNGRYHDQYLWAILADQRRARSARQPASRRAWGADGSPAMIKTP